MLEFFRMSDRGRNAIHPSSVPAPGTPEPVNAADIGSQILRPAAEVNVLVSWRYGKTIPLRLGKVTLNIREPTPDDARLYNLFNRNLSARPMQDQSMIVIPVVMPGERFQELPNWISNTYGTASNRYRRWPTGKVAA